MSELDNQNQSEEAVKVEGKKVEAEFKEEKIDPVEIKTEPEIEVNQKEAKEEVEVKDRTISAKIEPADENDEAKEKFEEVEVVEIGKNKYVEGIGRRKESIARVRLWDNSVKEVMNIYVNDRKYTDYFPSLDLQKSVDAPLRKLRIIQGYRVTVKTNGGGLRGQADAIKLGLARALVKLNGDWRVRLKKALFLRRDPRRVERKKYGLKKARRAPQWSKR